jgi:F-type H+-transporting ATPase subunit c
MKKAIVILFVLAIISAAPLLASPTEGATNGTGSAANMQVVWAVIIGGAALALAAMAGALAQSKAIVAVAEGISRNPAVAKNLQTLLILGLAFIESLVIYVLLIDLIIFFVKWGSIAG